MKTRLTARVLTSLLAAAALLAPLGRSATAAPLAFTSFTLINGWQPYSADTAEPAGAVDGKGVVHLKGAMGELGQVNVNPFVMPQELRPSRDVYVPVDMYDGRRGRLVILPDGAVIVQTASGQFSDATQFTSLEGVTYPRQ